MTRLRVGLTGGMASGKSTVARLLGEAGCTVVDADGLVGELYAAGGAGAAAVGEVAGPRVLADDGAVDHRALAARLFADDQLRSAVEQVIHPLVRRRFEEIAAASSADIVVLEATLLVEAGFGPDFDLVVTVEADPETRLRRAIARGLTAEQARARLLAQGDGEERRSGADITIENDGSPADLEATVERLMESFAHLLSEKRGTESAA